MRSGLELVLIAAIMAVFLFPEDTGRKIGQVVSAYDQARTSSSCK